MWLDPGVPHQLAGLHIPHIGSQLVHSLSIVELVAEQGRPEEDVFSEEDSTSLRIVVFIMENHPVSWFVSTYYVTLSSIRNPVVKPTPLSPTRKHV